VRGKSLSSPCSDVCSHTMGRRSAYTDDPFVCFVVNIRGEARVRPAASRGPIWGLSYTLRQGRSKALVRCQNGLKFDAFRRGHPPSPRLPPSLKLWRTRRRDRGLRNKLTLNVQREMFNIQGGRGKRHGGNRSGCPTRGEAGSGKGGHDGAWPSDAERAASGPLAPSESGRGDGRWSEGKRRTA